MPKKKTTFFYFTHLFLQNTHISLSILHIYSIKYSFFYNFLLFPSPFTLLSSLEILSHTTQATINDQSTIIKHSHYRSCTIIKLSVRSLPLYVSIVCLRMGYLIFLWVCGWFIMYCNLVMVAVVVGCCIGHWIQVKR